jgi:hypothetical protein
MDASAAREVPTSFQQNKEACNKITGGYFMFFVCTHLFI